MPDGASEQVNPTDGLTMADRLKTPLKPPWLVSEMVDVAGVAETTMTLPGLAVIVKSWTMKVMVVEREREPLEPVTVIE